MRILALDSSTVACSAAVWDSESSPKNMIAHRFEEMERGQSEALAPMVQGVLDEAGMAVRDMDFIAVTLGPGAFTGVRIGLAMAQALGLSSGVPIIGISTLQAVEQGVPAGERGNDDAWAVVVMDTKRGDIYTQTFNPSGAPAGEPEIIMPEDIPSLLRHVPAGSPVVIVGDATERVDPGEISQEARVLDDVCLPDAAIIAEFVGRNDAIREEAPSLEPIYLRPPYAKISPTGGRLRP